MITLLHGDFVEASRNEFIRLKEKAAGREIRSLDGRSLDDSLLVQSLESTSLFGGETVIFIERLFGKITKQPKRIESLCAVLAANNTADIVLWEDKELGVSVTKHLGPNVRNQVFKLPVVIFQFLDSLKPGNAAQLLSLFHKASETGPTEVIFSMLVKRVAQLVALCDHVKPEGLADWQANRLTTQAKSFTIDKLLVLYKELHDIEVSIKTGMSPFTLPAHIEQFIIQL